MTQTLKEILRENFPILLDKWEKRPFVVLSLIFLVLSIWLGKKWWDVNDEKNKLEVTHMKNMDSLKNEIILLKTDLKNCEKYEDYNLIIDSTLKTLFINNLLKTKQNEH